jgi:ABC-type dipeptide/oligopeptide/nickel transport system ATPase component
MRKRYHIAVIGEPGSGKSSFVKKIAEEYKGKVIVFMMQYNEVFSDYHQIKKTDIDSGNIKEKNFLFDPMELDSDKILESLRKFEGLIIFDDAFYHQDHRITDEFKRLLIARRQLNQDQISVWHGLSYIPKQTWIYLSHLVMFRTGDSDSGLKNIPEIMIPEIKKNLSLVSSKKRPEKLRYVPQVVKFSL